MVREARQPSLITPLRPRVSSSATTTTSRNPPPSFKYPSTSRIPRPAASSTVQKRAVLEERGDNVVLPALPARKQETNKKRESLSGSYFRQPPRIKAIPRPQASVKGSLVLHQSTTSSQPSPAINLPLDDNDTLLLNMRPPDILMSETDESGGEDMPTRRMAGRMLTPANSQEIPASIASIPANLMLHNLIPLLVWVATSLHSAYLTLTATFYRPISHPTLISVALR